MHWSRLSNRSFRTTVRALVIVNVTERGGTGLQVDRTLTSRAALAERSLSKDLMA